MALKEALKSLLGNKGDIFGLSCNLSKRPFMNVALCYQGQTKTKFQVLQNIAIFKNPVLFLYLLRFE